MGRTCLRCLGSDLGEGVNLRSGLIDRSAGGWVARLSKLTRTACQVCLTRMSSQGTRSVVKVGEEGESVISHEYFSCNTTGSLVKKVGHECAVQKVVHFNPQNRGWRKTAGPR